MFVYLIYGKDLKTGQEIVWTVYTDKKLAEIRMNYFYKRYAGDKIVFRIEEHFVSNADATNW